MCRRVSHLALISACLAQLVCADVTFEEARAIAEARAGVRLPQGAAPTTPWDDRTSPGFAWFADEEGLITWRVRLWDGAVVSCSRRSISEGARAISPEEAQLRATEEARKWIGPDADAIVWAVEAVRESEVRLWWRAPQRDDPPRWGLATDCGATVSLVDGSVLRFQAVPPTDPPLAVSITEREALELATLAVCRDLTRPVHCALAREHSLSQWRGEIGWRFFIRTGERGPSGEAPARVCTLDALTGSVVETIDPSGHASPPDGPNLGGPDSLSDDEARALAERHAAWSLADARANTIVSNWRRSLTWFFSDSPEGVPYRFLVDRTLGEFRGWWRMDADALMGAGEAHAATEADLLSRAADEARRHLGAAADGMTWEILPTAEAEVGRQCTARGTGRPAGDPPRTGLSPRCVVTFAMPSGIPIRYAQTAPKLERLIDPQVPPDDALARLGAFLEGDAPEVTFGPELRQTGGRLAWFVRGRHGGESFVGEVDAVTGKVTAVYLE